MSIIRSGEAMEIALRDCCQGIKIGKVLVHRDFDCGHSGDITGGSTAMEPVLQPHSALKVRPQSATFFALCLCFEWHFHFCSTAMPPSVLGET